MKMIYVYIKMLTFPGAITKAFFEQVMCRIFKCPVEDNRYLRTDEMCGHVEHELIKRPVASYMFCFIPGLLNFLLAFLLAWVPFVDIVFLGKYSGFMSYYAQSAARLAQDPVLSVIFKPIAEKFSEFILAEPMLVKTIDFLTPIFFLWLSISMLSNLFPLIEDALVMKEQYGKLHTALKIIFFPGYIIMRAGAWLEKYSISTVLLIAITFVLAIVVR